MKHITRVGLTAAVAAALAGTGAGAANAAPLSDAHHVRSDGSVFVQTDGLAGNAVIAYDRSGDGALHRVGTYPTGGRGTALAGSVVDHLASESSLVQHDGELLAVNAGSDTLTVFGVHGSRLERRQVVGTRGDAPVSVTAHGDRVFVLNARDGGSIQGYLDVHGRLVAVPSWHRDLGLDPDATGSEFTSTPAQIGFTPDGSQLVVTTKGGSSAFDVFSASALRLAEKPVVTTVAGGVPFGFQFAGDGTLIASEAGPNAVARFTVHRDGSVTPDATVATGQKATCWIVVDGRTVFASNAGSGTLSAFRLDGRGLTAAGTIPTDAGTVDAAVTPDGRFLYVQTGAAGIVDEFRVAWNGGLTRVGSVTVPGAIGGEGVVAD